jgi:Raf kinase inhibitor-like YbhB/YbcL family protein
MQGWASNGAVFVSLRVHLSALATLAAVLLAGCGGGSSSSTSTVPSSPAASTQGSASSVNAVALVSTTPIAKASYGHWLSVEKALGGTGNASHRALGFLITSDWVLAEATARGISVSEAEVKQRLAQIERQSFPKAGALQKFLAKSGESEADLLARVKVELLESRIAAQVTAGKSGSQSQTLLATFQKAFQQHWKKYTTCKAGYMMEDCSQYRGKPEDLAPTSSSSSSPSAGSASSSSASRASNASGELPSPPPGAMAITSPAFELNGAIPSQYTCDGANLSPPLEWQNVPSKAAALVLFIIDDSSTGPTGGIRWVVGDISPTAKGVAAGKTPEGGVVGSDTQGHSGYGGICPAHGKTSTIEFELYALSKKIPLSPGFQPAVAEQEYGAGKLLLGSGAVTYATYHRP